MAEPAEVIIEIEEDAAPQDQQIEIDSGKPETQKPRLVASDDEAINEFKAQVESLKTSAAEDRRLREEAERREAEARQEASRARGDHVDSQYDAVVNSMSAAEAEAKSAKQEYSAALASADYDKAADAQEKLADARAKLLILGQSKSDIEQARKAPPKIEPRQPSVDPVDAFLQSRTPATRTWLQSHKDVAESMVRGGDLGQIATGAHAEALRNGLKPDTDEYFALVETRLGLRQAEKPKPEPETPRQRKPMPSAPMSRENANGGTNGAAHVRLTAGQAATATDGTIVWTKYDKPVLEGKARAGDAIGVKEYARRVYEMNKADPGQFTRERVE